MIRVNANHSTKIAFGVATEFWTNEKSWISVRVISKVDYIIILIFPFFIGRRLRHRTSGSGRGILFLSAQKYHPIMHHNLFGGNVSVIRHI